MTLPRTGQNYGLDLRCVADGPGHLSFQALTVDGRIVGSLSGTTEEEAEEAITTLFEYGRRTAIARWRGERAK